MSNGMKKYEKSGPDVNAWKLNAQGRNMGAFSSNSFRKHCEAVGLEPTKRQAARYAKGKGLAYTMGRFA